MIISKGMVHDQRERGKKRDRGGRDQVHETNREKGFSGKMMGEKERRVGRKGKE